MMVKKQMAVLLLVCAMVFASLGTPANAAGVDDAVSIKDLAHEPVVLSSLRDWDDGIVERAFATVKVNIPANTIAKAKEDTFYLEVGETVKINCSYSPDIASVDFGLIAPDGYFYYERVTNGSINKTIKVNQHGEYILAVRNNSSDTVRVLGFVNY